jgi:hypothetical protein
MRTGINLDVKEKKISGEGHGFTGCGKIRDRAGKTYPFDKLRG